MTAKKWHKGPPPSVGWWPADTDCKCKGALRWWNGFDWSSVAWREDDARRAATAARDKSPYENYEIEWQHRPASWPARSKT